MNDNQDLQRISGRLLAMITSITPSLDLIEPLMDALMSILKTAEVSRYPAHMHQSYYPVVEDKGPLYASIESGVLPKSIAPFGELQGQGTRCRCALPPRS